MVSRKKTALRCLVAFTLISGFASAARAQAKQPVTHEALWLMPRVGAPAPSPDGKWVVVSVTEPAYDDKDQQSDLWVVPADGSAEARRLTRTKAAESGVAWSPDSRRIAFVTRREGDEAGQIHWISNGEDSRHFYEEVHAWLARWMAPATPQTAQK